MRLHQTLGSNVITYQMSECQVLRRTLTENEKLRTFLACWETAFLAKRSLDKQRDSVSKRQKRGAIFKQDK